MADDTQQTELVPEEWDEISCVGCGATVIDQGGDETLGWLGGDEGWFCPSCCEPTNTLASTGEADRG